MLYDLPQDEPISRRRARTAVAKPFALVRAATYSAKKTNVLANCNERRRSLRYPREGEDSLRLEVIRGIDATVAIESWIGLALV